TLTLTEQALLEAIRQLTTQAIAGDPVQRSQEDLDALAKLELAYASALARGDEAVAEEVRKDIQAWIDIDQEQAAYNNYESLQAGLALLTTFLVSILRAV